MNGDEAEKAKNFLITVIGNIFTTPTDKVFRTTEKQYMLDFSNYYKSITDIIKPIEDKENKAYLKIVDKHKKHIPLFRYFFLQQKLVFFHF